MKRSTKKSGEGPRTVEEETLRGPIHCVGEGGGGLPNESDLSFVRN